MTSPSIRKPKRFLYQWLLLCEAGALLLVARVALTAVPTARIVQWVRRPLRPGDPRSAMRLEDLRWAVTAFSRKAPVRLVCFPQALSMHAMLRRRRISSEVVYGAARLEDGKLVAHAWLRCNDRIWLGGEVSPAFTVLDTWKPDAWKPDTSAS